MCKNSQNDNMKKVNLKSLQAFVEKPPVLDEMTSIWFKNDRILIRFQIMGQFIPGKKGMKHEAF
jgi:hypothetical protein